MKNLVASLLVVCFVGCSGSSSITTDVAATPEAASPTDLSRADGEPVDAVVFPDLPAAEIDLVPDYGSGGELDLSAPTCEDGEGCFLAPCSENADCQSGWCIEHMGQKMCSQVCQEECPHGWKCSQVDGGSPDLVFVCVSDHPNLCRPCAQASDCEGAVGTEDACIFYGDQGSFCGGACLQDDDCPWGFSCKQVWTVDDIELLQCVADAGECPCTDTSIQLGLWTPCNLENEHGLCTGKRACTAQGLAPCDAEAPAAEICNGLDDNCNEEIDEPLLLEGAYIHLCEDENPCTDDKCTGAQGCVNEVIDSGSCDDSDPCTVADHCEAGTCVGNPVQCEDDNHCTDNLCTATGGCEFPPNSVICDDLNPCTVADTCNQGICSGTEVPCDCLTSDDCTTLEDDDLCNGTLFCDTAVFPYQCVVDDSTIVSCPAPEGVQAFCLQSVCAAETGLCDFAPQHEGFLCNNEDACTVESHCVQGQCSGGDPVNCNDGNPCTDDSCTPEAGCQHTPNQSACNDGDTCSTGDLCFEGECTGGEALSCDDGDACNGVETCNSQTGCQPGVPLVCDDLNPCNGTENCDPGQGCVPGVEPQCDDGNYCNGIEVCDPQAGCVPGAKPECDDLDPCNGPESCDPGQGCLSGEPLLCNDGNPCTLDSCQTGQGCLYQPQSDVLCDDDNLCTALDLCQEGVCQGTQPLACKDDNPCTDNSCDAAVGCVTTVNQSLCDDNDICTSNDHCHLGECISSGQMLCNDGNTCTDDSCHPQSGCQFTPNQLPCEDGNLCTTGDLCQGGWCMPGAPSTCDDDNECTQDSCLPDEGCTVDPVEDKAPCNGDQPLWWCEQGTCTCHADCDGRVCGPDGCGGSCGECQEPGFCVLGHCVNSLSLPDTGTDACWDFATEISCPGPGEEFHGQDAHYQTTPMSYTDNEDGTITDNVSGLVWARCTAGLSGPDCSGNSAQLPLEQAASFCQVNSDQLPGESWRLPNLHELTSLVDYDEDYCIRTDYFGGITGKYMWALPVGVADQEACFVSFGTCASGCSDFHPPEDPLPFRCVRGKPLGSGDFQDNGDGSIEDTATQLVWQQGHSPTAVNWKLALDYCQQLALAQQEDWRLPNARELGTLRDIADPNRGLFEQYFEFPAGNFWSSTTFKSDKHKFEAYALHPDGTLGYFGDSKFGGQWARCVRQECTPDCAGKQCGNDGCGGVCGVCQDPAVCEGGQCISEVVIWEDLFDDGSISPAWWSPGCIKWGSMGGCSTAEAGGNLILNATVGSTGNTYGGTAWAQTQTDFKTGDDYRVVFHWDYKVQAASLNCGIIEMVEGPVSVNQGGLFDHNIHTETAGRKFLNYQTTNLNFQTWSICIRQAEQTAAVYDNADCSGDPLKSVDLSALSKWYLRYLVCTATSAGFPANNVTLKLDWAEATKL